MTDDLKRPDSRRTDQIVMAAALVFPTLVTWVYFVLLADSSPAVQQAAYGIGKVIQFGFPVVWVLWICRERPRIGRPGWRELAEGTAFGLIVFAAMMALYHGWLDPSGLMTEAGEKVREKVDGFGLGSVAAYAALGVFYALFHSLLEEYYWRWFVFGRLRRLVSLPVALVVSSLGFMAHHVLVLGVYFGHFSLLTLFFSFCVAVGGAVWAWLYERHGSLWGPWISHLLVDAAIFTIGYFLLMPA